MKHTLKIFIILFVLLFAVSCVPEAAPPSSPKPVPLPDSPVEPSPREQTGELLMRVVNTGKSDCLIFAYRDGRALMVDTGRKKDFDKIDEALKQLGVSELQAVILTHGHKDHAGGLKKLLGKYPSKTVYTSSLDYSTFSAKELDSISEAGAEHALLSKGDVLEFGEANFIVLAPAVADPKEENNNSLVIRVLYGDTAFLLMGDALLETEQDIVNICYDLGADVIKLGHHGQDDATSAALLDAVKPSYAVITGNRAEDDDIPGKRVAALLDQKEIPYYMNEGDHLAVDFISDGSVTSAKKVYVR
ncbi:MAG: ComEC family competence protein [Firmicutes bacterium ADurb.Bin182]|nr:MAG: ComEC family competence protein [Firmicutes bacterium ADurb.Bin182]